MKIKVDTTISNSLGVNGATGSSAYPLRVETDSNKQIAIGEVGDLTASFSTAHETGGGATIFFSRNNGDLVSAIGTVDRGTTGLQPDMFFSSRNDFMWAGANAIGAATERMRLFCTNSGGLRLYNGGSDGSDQPVFSVTRANGNPVAEVGQGRDASGYMRLYNGSNYGLVVQGLANTPIIGAYTGGNIQFKGVSNPSRSSLAFESDALLKIDFNSDIVEVGGAFKAFGKLETSISPAGAEHLKLASPVDGVNVNFTYLIGDTSIAGANPKNLHIKGSSSASDIVFSPSSISASEGLLALDGSAGRVGVGTVSPEAKLHVFSDATAQTWMKLEGGGGVFNNVGILLNDKGTGTGNRTEIKWEQGTGDTPQSVISSTSLGAAGSGGADLRLETYDTNQDLNENQLVLTADNKLGIGTDAPTSKVTVNEGDITAISGASGRAKIQVAENDTFNNPIGIETDGSTNKTRLFNDGTGTQLLVEATGSGASLALAARSFVDIGTDHDGNDFGSYTSRVRIVNSTGNVGIGVTSPTQKLDVSGGVNISGDLYMSPTQVIRSNNQLWLKKTTTMAEYYGGTSTTTNWSGGHTFKVWDGSAYIDGFQIGNDGGFKSAADKWYTDDEAAYLEIAASGVSDWVALSNLRSISGSGATLSGFSSITNGVSPLNIRGGEITMQDGDNGNLTAIRISQGNLRLLKGATSGNSLDSHTLQFEGTNSAGADRNHAFMRSSRGSTNSNSGKLTIGTYDSLSAEEDYIILDDSVIELQKDTEITGATNDALRVYRAAGRSNITIDTDSGKSTTVTFKQAGTTQFQVGMPVQDVAGLGNRFAISYQGNPTFVIDSDEQIGVNTAAPEARFHIKDNGTDILLVENTATDVVTNPLTDAGNTKMNGMAIAINDTLSNNIPLIVAGNANGATSVTGTGAMSTTFGGGSVTGTSTLFLSQLEAGDVIEKSSYLATVRATSANTFAFIEGTWAGTSGSASFRVENQELFRFKDAAGNIKLKMEQNGGLALGINPDRSINTWFTIDTDHVASVGGTNKTGLHFTHEEAAIQIGGSAGDIGNESILIDQGSQFVGIVFKRSSHTDYKIANGNTSGLIISRGATAQTIYGSQGMRVGASVSASPLVDLHVDGDVMVTNKRIYLGTSTSTASTTTAQILSGTATPNSGSGVAAPKGSIYLKTNGGFGSTLWTKYGTSNTQWDAVN